MRLAIVAAALAASGCVSLSETPAPATTIACREGKPMVETMLFLGMARPNGSVSRYEFSQFVEQEVATRWKEGFTIVEANGMWFSDQRHMTEHEPSRILIRFHDGSAAASADIEAIRNAYIKQFTQDAVLRADRMTCADF